MGMTTVPIVVGVLAGVLAPDEGRSPEDERCTVVMCKRASRT
jgi:hypothetical protein